MRDDEGHYGLFTTDRPFSMREIGLTPHSPSGSSPTQKGNSRPLGTLILNKLRPLAPMPMSPCICNGRVMQSPSHKAIAIMHHPDKKFLLLPSMLIHFLRLRKIHGQHGTMD